ncbi:GNAT family N-acetyltransferase [Paraburkholderia dinghuensis]|uniref:GNAT family N-acetyltransferase n=1 Tax=Paraburkholderia dinghuensis TaxID=2305225 RepID=UPI0016276996|nr:GNAT family N-acetyltransferase [Paraburkholderia dinghuensis]
MSSPWNSMADERVVIRPVWMPQAAADSGTVLGELGPLLLAYWAEARPPGYGEFAFNVEGFVRVWMSRELVPFEIRLDSTLVGFLLLLRRQSLFCRDGVADIATVYLKPEVRHRGLMREAVQRVRELAGVLGITHLYRSVDIQGSATHRMRREELPCR